jgi:hypothetical protein
MQGTVLLAPRRERRRETERLADHGGDDVNASQLGEQMSNDLAAAAADRKFQQEHAISGYEKLDMQDGVFDGEPTHQLNGELFYSRGHFGRIGPWIP